MSASAPFAAPLPSWGARDPFAVQLPTPAECRALRGAASRALLLSVASGAVAGVLIVAASWAVTGVGGVVWGALVVVTALVTAVSVLSQLRRRSEAALFAQAAGGSATAAARLDTRTLVYEQSDLPGRTGLVLRGGGGTVHLWAPRARRARLTAGLEAVVVGSVHPGAGVFVMTGGYRFFAVVGRGPLHGFWRVLHRVTAEPSSAVRAGGGAVVPIGRAEDQPW